MAHEASWPPKKLLKKIPEKPNAGGVLGSVAAAIIFGSRVGVGGAAVVVWTTLVVPGTMAEVGWASATDGEAMVIGRGTGANASDTNGAGAEEEAKIDVGVGIRVGADVDVESVLEEGGNSCKSDGTTELPDSCLIAYEGGASSATTGLRLE